MTENQINSNKIMHTEIKVPMQVDSDLKANFRGLQSNASSGGNEDNTRYFDSNHPS